MSASERAPVTAFVGLGANLGDPTAALKQAISALTGLAGINLVRCSALYRSAPIDSSGPDYVNAVIEIQTTLCAPALLAALQALEQQAGRERPYPNAPRTLDLDLLLYGQGNIHSANLVVPHARMNQRAFVMLPLAEIAPHLVSSAQRQAVADQRIARI